MIKRCAFVLLSIFLFMYYRFHFKSFSGETLHLYYFLLFAGLLVSFISYWFTFFIVIVFILFLFFLIFIYFIPIYFTWMRLFIYFVLFVYFFLLSNDFIFHLAFWSNLYTLKLFVTYLSEMVLDLDNKFWRFLLNHSSLSNH